MTTDDAPRPLDDLLAPGRVAMLTTAGPGGLAARPVTCAEATATTLTFLVDRTARWAEPLSADPTPAGVTYADPGDSLYVALSGSARLLDGAEVVARLWTPAARAFFSGPDDPRAAALQVTVDDGEWWDGPGGPVRRAVALVRAALSKDAAPGESGAVALP